MPSIQRHFHSASPPILTMKRLLPKAASCPNTMNNWLKDTMRPRHAEGEISAMYIGAVISTAPTPKPLSKRATISVAKFSESAANSAETA